MSRDNDIHIRRAQPADAAALAEVERLSWPIELVTTETQFRDRIAVYPDGQLVAESGGRIVGIASAQRILAEFFEAHGDRYARLTNDGRFRFSHHAAGEIYQLIGVSVRPEFRGGRIGRGLVNGQIAAARSLPGVARILGLTRPVLYHRFQHVPIDEYVRMQDADGQLLDPVLAFHVEAGATIVSLHAGFRSEDRETCGYGVLIEYPVAEDG